MSLILGEIEKVKLPSYKGFSVGFRVAEKWIKSRSEDVLKVVGCNFQHLLILSKLCQSLMGETTLVACGMDLGESKMFCYRPENF